MSPQPLGKAGGKSGTSKKLRAWAVGRVLFICGSLGLTVLTIVQQGVKQWLTSVLQNGRLVVVWKGSPPRSHLQVSAKGGHGATVVFDFAEPISLAAGRYTLSVVQSGVELPIEIEGPNGSPSYSVDVRRFWTTTARVRFAPADPPFAGVYSDIGEKLGHPVAPKKTPHRVYQSFHERGTLIWLSDQNLFLIVRSLPTNLWSEISGPSYPTDPCVYSSTCLDRRENAPKNFHVPTGGAYVVWRDKGLKTDLGYMTGYCVYWDAVSTQQFDQGRLIGPLRQSQANNVATVLSQYSRNSAWEWQNLSGVDAPQCHTVEDDWKHARLGSPFSPKGLGQVLLACGSLLN